MRRILWLMIGIVITLALFLLGLTTDAAAGCKGGDCTCTLPVQKCLDKMAAELKNRGWIGIEMDKDEEAKILSIKRVIPGSPAEAAGLMPGDRLIALNGVPFFGADEEAFKKAAGEWVPGQTVEYTVSRDGLERKVGITLGKLPPDVMAQWIGMHMLEHVKYEQAKK